METVPVKNLTRPLHWQLLALQPVGTTFFSRAIAGMRSFI